MQSLFEQLPVLLRSLHRGFSWQLWLFFSGCGGDQLGAREARDVATSYSKRIATTATKTRDAIPLRTASRVAQVVAETASITPTSYSLP
jgi:hypothetical protein